MIHRKLILAASLLPLGACQMGAYDPGPQIAYDQQRLATLLGTRTAQPMERCLSSFPGMDFKVIGNTVVARSGGRVYLNQPSGNCSQANEGGAVLVLEPDPGGLYCANTNVRVVSNGGMQIGACRLNSWTPYR